VRYALPLALVTALLSAGHSNVASAHTPPPLLPEKQVAAMVDELSGETAKRNLEGLARFHRQRSRGFHAAAELIVERARAYGLSNVEILQFPTDGKLSTEPGWHARSTRNPRTYPHHVCSTFKVSGDREKSTRTKH
jgi:hypothetical protein